MYTFLDTIRMLTFRTGCSSDGDTHCPRKPLRTSRTLGDRSVASRGPVRAYPYIMRRNSVGRSRNLNGWTGAVVGGMAVRSEEASCLET